MVYRRKRVKINRILRLGVNVNSSLKTATMGIMKNNKGTVRAKWQSMDFIRNTSQKEIHNRWRVNSNRVDTPELLGTDSVDAVNSVKSGNQDTGKENGDNLGVEAVDYVDYIESGKDVVGNLSSYRSLTRSLTREVDSGVDRSEINKDYESDDDNSDDVNADVKNEGDNIDEIRLQDLFGMKLKDRHKLNLLYDERVRLSKSMVGKILMKAKDVNYMDTDSESLLNDIELRLCVLLWRAGLVKSVRLGDLLVRNNGVIVYSYSGDDHNRVYSRMSNVHALTKLTPGSVVVIKRDKWAAMLPDMVSYWENDYNQLSIPGYLRINFERGVFTRLSEPAGDEIRFPASMSFLLHSFRKG